MLHVTSGTVTGHPVTNCVSNYTPSIFAFLPRPGTAILLLNQTSLMLFTADEEADRYLCCGLIPNSKAAKKDTNKWVQVG